mgnify:CR=1 FL=1
MFGLGMPEILLILAIALIVIGPKKLPELAKTLGRAMGEFKRSAQDLKRSIDIDSTVQDPPPAPSGSLKNIIKEVNGNSESKESGSSPEPEAKTHGKKDAGQADDLQNTDPKDN